MWEPLNETWADLVSRHLEKADDFVVAIQEWMANLPPADMGGTGERFQLPTSGQAKDWEGTPEFGSDDLEGGPK